MDPPPPFDHPHHRRAQPHYPDPHHHFAGGSGGGGGCAVPVRSRYEHGSYDPLLAPYHHLPSDHHHHPPRAAYLQQPPPPPLPPPLPPQHRHDGAAHYTLPLHAAPDAYSSPPYQNPAPHHLYHSHQRHGNDSLRPVDEIRRVASHYHHHHSPPPLPLPLPPPPPPPQQLPWGEAEDERHRYAAAHQLRLSPSGSRKRQRCTMHDCNDLESSSSSGPPPRRLRQQPYSSYAPGDNFVDGSATQPGYISHESSMHSDSMCSRKMQVPSQVTLPGSPHSTAVGLGYPRRATQKSAPSRVSVWQRIEENPMAYAQSSPRSLPKEAHISPCKSNSSGSASKELANMVSVDCKGKSASGNDVDSNTETKKFVSITEMKKFVVKKNEKVLASILVKPSPQSKEKESSVKEVVKKVTTKLAKEKEGSVKKVITKPDKEKERPVKKVMTKLDKKKEGSVKKINTKPDMEKEGSVKKVITKPGQEKEGSVKKVTTKPDKVQKNLVGSTSKSMDSTVFPGAGAKKVKKIVIKKIVRKIGSKDEQISSSAISEKMDSIDASASAYEKEEGEITASCFEKDFVSAHNLVSTIDTMEAGKGVDDQKEENNTTEASNGVDDQKEENNYLTNSSKMNADSKVESTEILDPKSGSDHPGKEQDRSSMHPWDVCAELPIESMEVLDTSGSEHLGKEGYRSSVDSSVRTGAFVFEKQEGKILSLSTELNVAIACNSERNFDDGCEDSTMEKSKFGKDVCESNAVYVDRVNINHGTIEFSGSEDVRREDGKFLIGTNEGVALINNFIEVPSTAEASMSVREVDQKEDGILFIDSGEKNIASLGNSVVTPRTKEVNVSQDGQEEESNMLTHPSVKDFVSVSSCGALNSMKINVNEGVPEKEGRMLTETSEANTSVIHHGMVCNMMELRVNEDTQKEECEIRNLLESPKTKTEELIMSRFVGREVSKSLVGSNEKHAGTTDNSANTPEFDEASGPEDNCTEYLLNVRTALNEWDEPLQVEDTYIFNQSSLTNVDSTDAPPLDHVPVGDSTSDIVWNNGLGLNSTSQAEELMHLHRAYLSSKNDITLLPSQESSSVSGNSEQSVPTTLTLGRNMYFSGAESNGQPEKKHDLVEGQQQLDADTVTEFDGLGKRKGVAGDDLISAGVQNWLTLPPALNSSAISGQLLDDGTTVREDSLGIDRNVNDDTFVTRDHDVTQDMDQCESVHVFFNQDHSIKVCGGDNPQSDLLALKENSGDIGNQGGGVLSGLHSISSINLLDQYDYQNVDIPVANLNETVLPALESTDVMHADMDAELVSSEVSVDPDQTCHSNTEDPGAESIKKQDLLSSWIETIVSDAKKEQQLPSISLPDKLLAPEESGRAIPDSGVNSTVKSHQMKFTSSLPPKVTPQQANLPNSSLETPRLCQNVRHRTWHRGNTASSTSSLHVSHPSGLPPKLPLKKNGKTQNSYIRKGNALIRNPATGNHSHFSSSLNSQNKLDKPVMRRSMNFIRKVDSNDFVAHSNMPVERPKTPPLPLHTKSISCTTNLLEQLSQTSQKQHVPETPKENSVGLLNSGDDASKVYVRPKSNKLVAAQKHHPGDPVNSSTDKVLSLQPSTASDLYFKKRKNQIILSSSSDGQNTKDMTPTEGSNSGEHKGLMNVSSKNNTIGVKDIPQKALQTINNVGSFSHVWTLSGKQPQRNGFVGSSHMKAFPRILPWKRKIYYKNFRNRQTSLLMNTSSLRIVRKLLQTRKRDMIYTVSTDGFSLRKSGVLSVGGSSLKWLRSLKKHSQKDYEEATSAVAEVERKKREKRKRQSLRDKGRNDQYSISVVGSQLRNNHQTSSDLRSSTCNEYVRVNKGNQLVRNPKKVIRMLASEKVRWSLHTIRSRLAKKQQYCQFFTRYGECKKPGGKCPYLHDQAKVAICTKFLKGLCSNNSCKLTHKVLPERMPDCSYFVRGLCTNPACPYRHVKVNSNALVCENFLKGYCADGDECHKKHSYVCPIFEASGECPQQSRCKLHHPKKKIKSERSKPGILQNSSWGRYFDTTIGHDSETVKVLSSEDRQKQQVLCDVDSIDFICLDADADEDAAELDAMDDIQLMELDSRDLKVQADNLDALIKPIWIMRTARV